ncbi:MAG: outer membrane beta-barrel protein, partial [Alphaproteobacteria bacterium]|nr:outer membrane beta-barrel protein [Alphaproteobacteria bacterium]
MNTRSTLLALAASIVLGIQSAPASAQDYTGNFMVRAGVSVVNPDTSADVFAGGSRIVGADAEVSSEVIPSATLTYFFSRNVAVELFCCFAKHDVDGKGALNGVDLGDTWIFPPAVTLQYHFDSVNGFKPYVGAGVQYIAFFDEGRSGGLAGNPQLEIDDAFGFTLQAGVDLEVGQGWYVNADVKKTWLEADAKW